MTPPPNLPAGGDYSEDTTFQYLHWLKDAFLLLGGRQDIADVLERMKDKPPTQAEVEQLRSYCITLTEDLKRRLAALHRIKIQPIQP